MVFCILFLFWWFSEACILACKYFMNWLQRWHNYCWLILVFCLASECQRKRSLFLHYLPKRMLEKKNEIGFYSRSLIIPSLNTGLAPANLSVKTKSLFIFYLLYFIFWVPLPISHTFQLWQPPIYSVYLRAFFFHISYMKEIVWYLSFLFLWHFT